MKQLTICIFVASIIGVSLAMPHGDKVEALTSKPVSEVNILPVDNAETGPNAKRKARQYYDNTNIDAFSNSGFSAGLGGFSDYSNSGFDISQQQGFGGGYGGFGGYGGGGYGGGGYGGGGYGGGGYSYYG